MTESEAARRRFDPDGANTLYIDQPTIKVGMTVETYRRVRARHKAHRLRDRRVSSDELPATAGNAHDKSNV